MLERKADGLVKSDLSKAAASVIRKGSASFSLASRLLGRKERWAILWLYAWFRHCDDTIDGQSLGFVEDGAPPATLAKLRELEAATYAALTGATTQQMPFAGLAQLAKSYSLPPRYFEDFLAGMTSDLEGVRPESFRDLVTYCYQVAGTVGLLFAHIVGISDAAALRHAAHLGIAMQLTNIARDVADDHRAGRCYVPSSWLSRAGICGDLMAPQNRAALTILVKRLLRIAERYYQSGESGIERLPFRAALAVATARRIYAEIGREVVARGPDAWTSRVVISRSRKLWLTMMALVFVLKSLPRRISYPWKSAPLPADWRYT